MSRHQSDSEAVREGLDALNRGETRPVGEFLAELDRDCGIASQPPGIIAQSPEASDPMDEQQNAEKWVKDESS